MKTSGEINGRVGTSYSFLSAGIIKREEQKFLTERNNYWRDEGRGITDFFFYFFSFPSVNKNLQLKDFMTAVTGNTSEMECRYDVSALLSLHFRRRIWPFFSSYYQVAFHFMANKVFSFMANDNRNSASEFSAIKSSKIINRLLKVPTIFLKIEWKFLNSWVKFS